MRYEEIQPSERLQPFVKCIWQLQREYRPEEAGEVLWPDGCQELIFHYGSSYTAGGVTMPGAFFIGMLSHYHQLHACGHIRLFGVRLLPWGLAAFSKRPAQSFKDQFVPLSDLLESDMLDELTGKLSGVSMDEAVPLLEHFLLSILHEADMDWTMVELLSKLYREPMEVDVSWAVEKSGYSQRQFERKCIDLVGMSAKRLQTISRFNQARLRIMFNPGIDLHECMLEFGYYDYAHFSKDFKHCLGITPTEYQRWIRRVHQEPHHSDDVVFLPHQNEIDPLKRRF